MAEKATVEKCETEREKKWQSKGTVKETASTCIFILCSLNLVSLNVDSNFSFGHKKFYCYHSAKKLKEQNLDLLVDHTKLFKRSLIRGRVSFNLKTFRRCQIDA